MKPWIVGILYIRRPFLKINVKAVPVIRILMINLSLLYISNRSCLKFIILFIGFTHMEKWLHIFYTSWSKTKEKVFKITNAISSIYLTHLQRCLGLLVLLGMYLIMSYHTVIIGYEMNNISL